MGHLSIQRVLHVEQLFGPGGGEFDRRRQKKIQMPGGVPERGMLMLQIDRCIRTIGVRGGREWQFQTELGMKGGNSL